MKQIFDWLREQMEKVKCEVYSPADVVWNNAVKMCLREVDEAEAKWETEVCEWERAEWNPKYVINSPHKDCMPLSIVDLKNQPYCNHCGKRIKISEVE